MKQSELNRAIARTTGVSVRLIEALGFSVLRLPTIPSRPRRRPQAILGFHTRRRKCDERPLPMCA